MRLSRYFLPASEDRPAEAQIASHRLMLREGDGAAGSGRHLRRSPRLSRAEEYRADRPRGEDRAGAIELLMPTLQLADLWRESGRYEDYGKEMLRITDRHERELLYGPTNEEMITEIFRAYVHSYSAAGQSLPHPVEVPG